MPDEDQDEPIGALMGRVVVTPVVIGDRKATPVAAGRVRVTPSVEGDRGVSDGR